MNLALVHYDPAVRRLWLRGQRCHHGATGAVLATAGLAGVIGLRSRGLAALAATGALLMAHDWHDRTVWFARGWQD